MSDSFMHAADLHLGAPLDALAAGIDPDKVSHLRGLVLSAFDNMVEAAIERDVSFVVIAGDVYDSADREVAAQFRFHAGLSRLSDAGVPVFIVHGNHDPLSGRFRPVRPFPESVRVFGSDGISAEIVELPSGRRVRVAGVSYSTQHETRNLALDFASLEPLTDVPTVAVMHANVGGVAGFKRYAECSRGDLTAAPVDYWALGHIHKRSVEQLPNGAWMAYSGNLQGRSAKASECEPKGVLVVPIDGSGFGPPEFVECDTVRFHRSSVDVSPATDLGEVVDLITSHLHDATASAGERPLLAHLDLVGATPLHRELALPGDLSLLEIARSEVASLLGDGELVRIRVGTRGVVPRSQLLGRGDLLAEVLTAVDSTDHGPQALLEWFSRGDLGSDGYNLLTAALAGGSPDGSDLDTETMASQIWARAEQILIDQLEQQP